MGGPQQPEVITADKTILFLSIVGVIPAHVLTFGILWWVVTERGRHPFWKTVGFEWPPTWNRWLVFGLCAIAAVVLLGIGGVITNFFGGGKTDLDLLIESSLASRLAAAFLAVATAP